MILVDYREDSRNKGSKGIWDDLKYTKLPIEQSSLDAGDLMFCGHGPDGEVTVGVEFKKVADLLTSIRSGRMQQQIEKMQPYDFRYLLIEGEWRANETGLVSIRKGRGIWAAVPGRFSASELDQTLLGFALRCGVTVWQTTVRKETVRWIESLYHNFCDRRWEEHTSHVATTCRPATLVPLSDFRTFIMGIPGVGAKTSLAVEKHFQGSIRGAVKARAKEWERVDGVGRKGAAKIDTFLA